MDSAPSFMVEKAVKGFNKGDITAQEFNHLISLAVHGSKQNLLEDREQEVIYGSEITCMPVVWAKSYQSRRTKWKSRGLAGAGDGKHLLSDKFVDEYFPFQSRRASRVWLQVARDDETENEFRVEVRKNRTSRNILHIFTLTKSAMPYLEITASSEFVLITKKQNLLRFKAAREDNVFTVWSHVLSSISTGLSHHRLYFGSAIASSPSVRWGFVFIPLVLVQCLKLLKVFSLRVEGLFRQPGDAKLVQQLVDAFECQNYVNLSKSRLLRFSSSGQSRHSGGGGPAAPLSTSSMASSNALSARSNGAAKPDPASAAAVASLMKRYLSELPEPPFTFTAFEQLRMVWRDIGATHLRIAACRRVILDLPHPHRDVVVTLLVFFKLVARFSHVNKMTPKNLAVCFAPSMSKPRQTLSSVDDSALFASVHMRIGVLEFLITHIDELFPPHIQSLGCNFLGPDNGVLLSAAMAAQAVSSAAKRSATLGVQWNMKRIELDSPSFQLRRVTSEVLLHASNLGDMVNERVQVNEALLQKLTALKGKLHVIFVCGESNDESAYLVDSLLADSPAADPILAETSLSDTCPYVSADIFSYVPCNDDKQKSNRVTIDWDQTTLVILRSTNLRASGGARHCLLFRIASLLSSSVVYGCRGDLHRGDMSGKFDIMSDLFDFRRGCENDVTFNAHRDIYPQLVLALRECDVPFTDLGGSAVDPCVYMEASIAEQLGANAQTVELNITTHTLRTCFPKRTCLVEVSKPTEADRRNLSSSLRQELCRITSPKTVMGVCLSGAGFAELARGLVKATGNGVSLASYTPASSIKYEQDRRVYHMALERQREIFAHVCVDHLDNFVNKLRASARETNSFSTLCTAIPHFIDSLASPSLTRTPSASTDQPLLPPLPPRDEVEEHTISHFPILHGKDHLQALLTAQVGSMLKIFDGWFVVSNELADDAKTSTSFVHHRTGRDQLKTSLFAKIEHSMTKNHIHSEALSTCYLDYLWSSTMALDQFATNDNNGNVEGSSNTPATTSKEFWEKVDAVEKSFFAVTTGSAQAEVFGKVMRQKLQTAVEAQNDSLRRQFSADKRNAEIARSNAERQLRSEIESLSAISQDELGTASETYREECAALRADCEEQLAAFRRHEAEELANAEARSLKAQNDLKEAHAASMKQLKLAMSNDAEDAQRTIAALQTLSSKASADHHSAVNSALHDLQHEVSLRRAAEESVLELESSASRAQQQYDELVSSLKGDLLSAQTELEAGRQQLSSTVAELNRQSSLHESLAKAASEASARHSAAQSSLEQNLEACSVRETELVGQLEAARTSHTESQIKMHEEIRKLNSIQSEFDAARVTWQQNRSELQQEVRAVGQAAQRAVSEQLDLEDEVNELTASKQRKQKEIESKTNQIADLKNEILHQQSAMTEAAESAAQASERTLNATVLRLKEDKVQTEHELNTVHRLQMDLMQSEAASEKLKCETHYQLLLSQQREDLRNEAREEASKLMQEHERAMVEMATTHARASTELEMSAQEIERLNKQLNLLDKTRRQSFSRREAASAQIHALKIAALEGGLAKANANFTAESAAKVEAETRFRLEADANSKLKQELASLQDELRMQREENAQLVGQVKVSHAQCAIDLENCPITHWRSVTMMSIVGSGWGAQVA